MISNQTALRRRSSFSCYIVISSVIFLALLFVVIQEHQLVVAQTVDNAIRSFSSNNTELRKPSSIGLTAIEISREISNVLDYHGEKGGLLVTDVRPDGPADHAGIKGGNQSFPINGLNVKLGGDIILTVDNNTFVNDTEFQRYYKHKVNGESMALKILRDGKSKMVNLIVGQNPSQIYENSTKFRDPNYINLSTYQDINFGIKIGYPSSWNSSIVRGSIKFFSNYENSDDITRAYVKIDVIPGISNLSGLVAYTGYTNATTIESPNLIHLGPYDAQLAIYKFLDTKHGQIQLMKVATTINDTGYLLSFYAQEPSFHNYLPTIRRMIDSFRVINITNEERFDLGLRIKYPSDWTLQGPKVFLGVDNQDWNMLNLTDDRNKTALKLSISPQYDNAAEAEKVFNQIVKLASTLPNFPNVRLNSTDLRNHEAGRSSYFVNYSYGDPDYGKVITIQNITRSNDRVYWSEYSTIKEDYLKNFDLIRQVLSSLETFKIFRYENPFLGIISYYPSDWKHSDNSFYSPSYYGGFDSGKLEYYSQTDREPPYCDLTDLTSPTNTSKISKLSLNTTLGAKIDVKKIVSRENEVYEGYYSNETRQRQQMIICYNIHGKSYGANYTQTVYPGDVSYLSTAERIINSSRLIDINSSRASNKVYYKNSSDFAFSYPPGWLLMESKYAVSLNQNDSSLLIGPVIRNNTEIDQLATTDIDILVKTPSEYKFINSTIVKSNNISGYQITFQYNGTKYLYTYLLLNSNVYPIIYSAPLDDYYNYLPQVDDVIKSFRPMNNSLFKPTGYPVGGSLSGIAINPNTNILYVADTQFNLVHVLDSTNNKKIIDIPVGKSPGGIAIDPGLNTIYVANSDSNSISVIDGSKNVVSSTIPMGEEPLIIAANTITHMAYVGDANTHALYRIDGISHNVTQLLTGGENKTDGVGVAIDERTDRVYVANPDTRNVTIIDGKVMKILSNISLSGQSPMEIAVNPLSNTGYILTNEFAGVIAMDLSNNELRYVAINESMAPFSLAVNRLKNLVYISDYSTDSQVHVMDASDNRSSSITVDPFPTYLAVDSGTGITYVSTTFGTVSMIDNDANQTRYGIRYHINSNTSGSIFCNGKELSDNYYTTYLTNELVTCNVNSTNSFSPILSTSWKLDDHDTYRQTIGSPYLLSFNVTGHGDLNVSIEDIPSLIQRWGSIMSLVTVILVIVLAAIPSMKFHGKTNTRQEGKHVLKRDEILGINASVIVGVLVFLSLEGFNRSQQSEITFVTASIVFPFVISVIVTILGKNNFATRLMIAGFINLMISIILIVSLRYGS